jgi:hypothetical protein
MTATASDGVIAALIVIRLESVAVNRRLDDHFGVQPRYA